MVKADGSVLVHADAGGYKPLNWMTPPTVIEEEDGPDRRAQARRARTGSRSGIAEVLSDVDARHGRGRRGSRRTASRRDLQERAGRRAGVLRRGLPARAPRVADRHRPGRPDVPRRGGRLDRGRDQARSARSTPSSSSRATWSGSASTRRWPTAAACSPRQTIKPQARVLAEARGHRLRRGRPRRRCAASASRTSRCSASPPAASPRTP